MNRFENVKYLCRAEVCEYLGITSATLWRYEKLANLPSHRPDGGRPFYDKEEIDEWLKGNRK